MVTFQERQNVALAILNVVGLILEVAGGVLMATDLMSRRQPLRDGDDARTLLLDLARATEEAIDGRPESLRSVSRRCYTFAMEDTAAQSRASRQLSVLRLRGRVGLSVFLVGSVVQLAAAVGQLR